MTEIKLSRQPAGHEIVSPATEGQPTDAEVKAAVELVSASQMGREGGHVDGAYASVESIILAIEGIYFDAKDKAMVRRALDRLARKGEIQKSVHVFGRRGAHYASNDGVLQMEAEYRREQDERLAQFGGAEGLRSLMKTYVDGLDGDQLLAMLRVLATRGFDIAQ